MLKHKHAELMAQYAQDAMETDSPWERWEFCRAEDWRKLKGHPVWSVNTGYRRKPKTSRERFTEWAEKRGWALEWGQGSYDSATTELAWHAWQEAERQALSSGDAERSEQ